MSRLDQMQDLNVPYNGFQPKPKSSKYRSFNDSYGQPQAPSLKNLPPQLRNTQPESRAVPNLSKFVHQNQITSPYKGSEPEFHSADPDITPIETLEGFQPTEEEKKHIRETFTPSSENVSCKDLLEHVKHCPLCKKYYKTDIIPYIIIIFILVIILIILLKKVLS